MGISFNAASLLNGNGIDVSSVVSELQTARSGQLTAWQSDLSTLQTQGTSITNINNDLSTLASAAQALSDPVGVLTQLTASSSESAIVSASAQNGATVSNYDVVVNKGVDVILCCNVLIYFDLASKRQVIRQFHDNLLPHGYLFLGHAESLYGVNSDFRLVHLPSATAYVKEGK